MRPSARRKGYVSQALGYGLVGKNSLKNVHFAVLHILNEEPRLRWKYAACKPAFWIANGHLLIYTDGL